jgi:hypothetical protein
MLVVNLVPLATNSGAKSLLVAHLFNNLARKIPENAA